MISANTAAEIEKRRQAFLRKWTLKCRAVSDSLEEAGNRLFSFTRLDPSQWTSARTTNAISDRGGSMGRLHAITALVKSPPARMNDKGYDALIPAGKCFGRHLSQNDKKLYMTRPWPNSRGPVAPVHWFRRHCGN